MPFYKSTIEILVDVENEAEACDCIAESLRSLLANFNDGSSVIDWRYADSDVLPEPDNGAGFEYVDELNK